MIAKILGHVLARDEQAGTGRGQPSGLFGCDMGIDSLRAGGAVLSGLFGGYSVGSGMAGNPSDASLPP